MELNILLHNNKIMEQNKFNGSMIHIEAENFQEARKQYLQILSNMRINKLGEWQVLAVIKPEENIFVDAWTIIVRKIY